MDHCDHFSGDFRLDEVLDSQELMQAEKPTLSSTATSPVPVSTRSKGLFVFINIISSKKHEPRLGAKEDSKKLKKLYEGMGFDVKYFKDLTKAEFLALIKNLTTHLLMNQYDIFHICIGSHGLMFENETYIICKDAKILNTNFIVQSFCVSLADMQKVFIFNCCRNICDDRKLKIKHETYLREIKINGENSPPIKDNNTLICYATSPGTFSYRNTFYGSYFITEIYKVLGRARKEDFADLLKIMELMKIVCFNLKDEERTVDGRKFSPQVPKTEFFEQKHLMRF